jgi:hypothetical protein
VGIYVAGNLPLAGGRRVLAPLPLPDWSILVACLAFGVILGAYPALLNEALKKTEPPG